MKDQQIVLLLFVRVDLIEFRRCICRRQFCPNGAGVRGSRANTHAEHRVGGALLLQRQVHGDPGLQRRLSGQQPRLLGLQSGKLLQQSADFLAGRLGPFRTFGTEELLLRDRLPLDEQAVLDLPVSLDGSQSRIDVSQLGPGLRQGRGSALQQRGPGRVGQLVIRLADLHTSQLQEALQQFFPMVGHGNHAEFLHFYNGHFSVSQPFRQ